MTTVRQGCGSCSKTRHNTRDADVVSFNAQWRKWARSWRLVLLVLLVLVLATLVLVLDLDLVLALLLLAPVVLVLCSICSVVV